MVNVVWPTLLVALPLFASDFTFESNSSQGYANMPSTENSERSSESSSGSYNSWLTWFGSSQTPSSVTLQETTEQPNLSLGESELSDLPSEKQYSRSWSYNPFDYFRGKKQVESQASKTDSHEDLTKMKPSKLKISTAVAPGLAERSKLFSKVSERKQIKVVPVEERVNEVRAIITRSKQAPPLKITDIAKAAALSREKFVDPEADKEAEEDAERRSSTYSAKDVAALKKIAEERVLMTLLKKSDEERQRGLFHRLVFHEMSNRLSDVRSRADSMSATSEPLTIEYEADSKKSRREVKSLFPGFKTAFTVKKSKNSKKKDELESNTEEFLLTSVEETKEVKSKSKRKGKMEPKESKKTSKGKGFLAELKAAHEKRRKLEKEKKKKELQ